MFQYAYGCVQAYRHGLPLRLDLSYLQQPQTKHRRVNRTFRLDVFDLEYQLADERTIAFLRSKLGKRLNRINTKRLQQGQKPFWVTHLVGYWQSAKYFQDFDSLIRQRLCFKPLTSTAAFQCQKQITEDPCPVMVHIRRGDYVDNPKHEVCTVDYFREAMQQMMDRFPSVHFLVFSDDLAWCRQFLPFQDRLAFVDGCATEAEEMYLMTRCHHYIISNSSFSWWGAWLGDHVGKTVFAPSRWSPDEVLNAQFINQEQIVLKEWDCIAV